MARVTPAFSMPHLRAAAVENPCAAGSKNGSNDALLARAASVSAGYPCPSHSPGCDPPLAEHLLGRVERTHHSSAGYFGCFSLYRTIETGCRLSAALVILPELDLTFEHTLSLAPWTCICRIHAWSVCQEELPAAMACVEDFLALFVDAVCDCVLCTHPSRQPQTVSPWDTAVFWCLLGFVACCCPLYSQYGPIHTLLRADSGHTAAPSLGCSFRLSGAAAPGGASMRRGSRLQA